MHTRRQFVVRAGTAAATAILSPTSALAAGLNPARPVKLARGGRFSEGVMSGEPTPSAITLWTRLGNVEGTVGVDLEVATDKNFRHVVAHKRLTTGAPVNHNVKTRITGLKAHEQYYYRFATATKDGPVGRFRTALPADSLQPVRFAFWSCQDYTHGYYNAHELLAKEDLDFVICLGDYIYDETYHSTKGGTGVRNDGIGRSLGRAGVVREAITLDDYRAKYALYRSDEALRKVQARFPTVMLWDDHEVSDNYAGGAPGGGLPASRDVTVKRKAVAYRAFFETMPYSPPKPDRIYRRLQFGRTVDLLVMDQRQYRADQPCGDAVAPPCADWNQPRAFLGRTQMNWLKGQLSASKAAWKVLANEVMIMPTKVLGGSFYTFDSWQGYPQEREELLTHIRDRQIKDVVFVTGDIHTFVNGDVRTNMGDGDTVAVEFVGGSITSQGLGETDLNAGGGTIIKGNDANPHTDPALLEALKGINPWIDSADTDHHGYGKVVATKDSFDCQMVRLQTIKKRSTAKLPSTGMRYHVARGQQSIKGTAV
ncbi:MAG TPA: alkaline phosphatase D family protein [Solirubrobacteraceae bacterium]|nr:alkaline phosphatase D family protein [Solirubrobacteraceae bacterium]